MLGNEVVDYQVEVKGLHHRDGTRDVVQFNVTGFNTKMREATINQGLGINDVIERACRFSSLFLSIAGEVPYNITVRALNLAGCGQQQQLYCFTQEGGKSPYYMLLVLLVHQWISPPPLHTHTHHTSVPPSPTNVVVVRFDPTTIGVSWTKFTLVELKGLASYIVTYNIVIGSRKRQLGGMITVPWTENRVIIPNLQPGAQYDITVTTSTLAGMSGTIP